MNKGILEYFTLLGEPTQYVTFPKLQDIRYLTGSLRAGDSIHLQVFH